MKPQVYLYLVIFIFIFMRFLQLSPKETKTAYNQEIEANMTIKEYPKGCWYSTEGLVFQISDCQRFEVGAKVLIFGKRRVSTANQSDKIVFVDVTDVYLDYTQNSFIHRPIQKTQAALFEFRLKIYSRIKELILEPEASLFFSLIFGGKSFLSPETEEKITQAGVNHLIAASGMNISLLFLLVNQLFVFFPRRTKSWLTLILIFIYVHLAGLSVSIIRAGLMGAISLISSLFFKKTLVIWNLFLAAVIILGFNPRILFDVGFQLSFTAVFGILCTQAIFSRSGQGWFTRLETAELLPLLEPKPNFLLNSFFQALKDSFFVSLTVNLWIWPITVYHFGQLSLAGLISSIFLSWLLMPIFVLGWWLLVIALFIPNGGILDQCLLVLSFPLHWLMSFFLLTIDFFAQLKFLNFEFEFENWLWPTIWYLVLFIVLLVIFWYKRQPKSQTLMKNYETLFSH